GIKSAKPAIGSFLGRPPTDTQESRARSRAAGERHQVSLVSACTMEQHERCTIGVLWPIEPMDERKVTGRKALLTRKRKLRQHHFQIVCAVSIARWKEEDLSELVRCLVNGHAWPIRRILHEHASRVSDIKGQKILPVVNL